MPTSIKSLYRELIPVGARDLVRTAVIQPYQKVHVLVSRELTRRLPHSVEPHIQAILQRYLGPGSTYVDVGANWGDLASVALGLVAPNGCVVCFEPMPSNFAKLMQTLSRKSKQGVRLVLEQRAVGDSEAPIELYINFWDGQHTTDAEVNRGGQRGQLTVGQVKLDDALAYHQIAEVSMLKIDVEGAELRVLIGAEKMLADGKIAAVILEMCNPAEPGKADNAEKITNFLRDRGYEGQLVTMAGLSPWDPRACTSRQDVLFLRPDGKK